MRLDQVGRGRAWQETDSSLLSNLYGGWGWGVSLCVLSQPSSPCSVGEPGMGTQGSHTSSFTTVISRDILVALGVSDPVPH